MSLFGGLPEAWIVRIPAKLMAEIAQQGYLTGQTGHNGPEGFPPPAPFLVPGADQCGQHRPEHANDRSGDSEERLRHTGHPGSNPSLPGNKTASAVHCVRLSTATRAARASPVARVGYVVMYGLGWFSVNLAAIVYNTAQVTCRQRTCPPDLLGRMNATVRWIVWVTLPLGALLLGGTLATVAGPRDLDSDLTVTARQDDLGLFG